MRHNNSDFIHLASFSQPTSAKVYHREQAIVSGSMLVAIVPGSMLAAIVSGSMLVANVSGSVYFSCAWRPLVAGARGRTFSNIHCIRTQVVCIGKPSKPPQCAGVVLSVNDQQGPCHSYLHDSYAPVKVL